MSKQNQRRMSTRCLNRNHSFLVAATPLPMCTNKWFSLAFYYEYYCPRVDVRRGRCICSVRPRRWMFVNGLHYKLLFVFFAIFISKFIQNRMKSFIDGIGRSAMAVAIAYVISVSNFWPPKTDSFHFWTHMVDMYFNLYHPLCHFQSFHVFGYLFRLYKWAFFINSLMADDDDDRLDVDFRRNGHQENDRCTRILWYGIMSHDREHQQCDIAEWRFKSNHRNE